MTVGYMTVKYAVSLRTFQPVRVLERSMKLTRCLLSTPSTNKRWWSIFRNEDYGSKESNAVINRGPQSIAEIKEGYSCRVDEFLVQLLLIKMFDECLNVFFEHIIPFSSVRNSHAASPITPRCQDICDKEISSRPHIHEPLSSVPEGYPKVVYWFDFDLYCLKLL
jgi:hypothetical protein